MHLLYLNIFLLVLVGAGILIGFEIADDKNKKRIEYLEAVAECLLEINTLLQKKNAEINYKTKEDENA